jgi:hypothetical protein
VIRQPNKSELRYLNKTYFFFIYYLLEIGIPVLLSKKRLLTGLCPPLSKSNITAIEPALASRE